jgi:hypothetical protein
MPTRTTLSTSATPSVLGSPLTLTATVSVPAPGYGTPTGSVRFYDGTTLLGTSPVNGGVAALALFSPYLGVRELSAVYVGDGKFSGSVSSPRELKVVATAKPKFAAITDVKGDQGRQVRIEFGRSPYDHLGSGRPITKYDIFRRINGALAASEADAGGNAQSAPAADKIAGWDFVGSVAAYTDPIYNLVVPTLADSNSTGLHRSTFFVRAATATPGVFYDSAADSGYSVDNIAPAAPLGLHRQAGGVLAWQESPAADFQYFTVYGSTVNYLDAGATVVGHTTAINYGVAGQAHVYFLVTATDANGNEGPAAVLYDATPVPGAQPTLYALHPCVPNPFNPATTIRFDLPQASPVRVRVYDMAGRLVQTLVDGAVLEAGSHDVMWRGDDASGRHVAAGTYFCRMEAGVFSGTQRMTLVK